MTLPALANPVSEDARTAVGRLAGARQPRVVLLSTWHPEPADNGRKQRTRRMIDALAGAYDVILVSLLPDGDPPEPLPAVPHIRGQLTVRLPPEPRSPLRLVASALHSYPRSQVTIWNQMTAERVGNIVSEVDAQVVIGTDLRTVRYLTHLPSRIVTILDEPDVSPFVVRSGPALGGPKGLRALALQRKLRRLLRDAAGGLDGVLVASALEAEAYREFAEAPMPAVVENGIAALPERTWQPHIGGTLLYTGSITYQPNYEAVAFMQRAVLPRLAAAGIDVQLMVTGRLPEIVPASVRSPHIAFTGVLPDLESTFLSASMFVCPLQAGTGTRVKLIEAMAYGLPIVSTRKGAEGLAVEDGVHLLLADSAHEFADAIQLLCGDEALALTLGANARVLVRQRYTWESQGTALRALVGQLIQAAPTEMNHG